MSEKIEVAWTREEFEQAKRGAVEKALITLQTPVNEVVLDHEVEVVRSEREVLDCEGLTLEEAIEQPWLLLSGDAYDGGSTMAVDPFHPTARSLIEMRFAAHVSVESKRPEPMRAAVDRVEGFLRGEGVPQEVGRVSAIGRRAQTFEILDVVALMPKLKPPLHYCSAPPTWADRAEATHLLLGALANMPGSHPARLTVEDYVGLLSNPTVRPVQMDPAEEAVLHALSR